MKKTVFLALLLAAATGIGWRFWSIAQKEQAAAQEQKAKPPVPVTLALAATRDVPLEVRVMGRAEAFESVSIKPRIAGQVASVSYREGQPVRAGQLLLQLDTGDLEAELRQTQANLARAHAELARARADLKRYGALKEQGFVSEEKLEELRATLAAAESTVKADEAAVDLARLRLGYASLRAPMDGLVGERLVHPGSMVKENETVLAVVNRVQPLFLAFTLPEHHLGRLRLGLGSGSLVARARVPGRSDREFQGRVRYVDPAVDTATGTIRLKAELPNADQALSPGQFLEVALTLETLHQVVTVPAESVQQGPNGSFVWVVDKDGSARMRPVTLATQHGGLAALSEGLRVGERVVVDGHSRLNPGAKVKETTGKAGPGPGRQP